MFKAASFSVIATLVVFSGAPAWAGGIAGAGSGSDGGVLTGTTNETSGMMQTGVPSGQQPVAANGMPLPNNAMPNDAVLNADGEAKPGTTGTSQPSSLNGK